MCPFEEIVSGTLEEALGSSIGGIGILLFHIPFLIAKRASYAILPGFDSVAYCLIFREIRACCFT
jgi:hypothetical protein